MQTEQPNGNAAQDRMAAEIVRLQRKLKKIKTLADLETPCAGGLCSRLEEIHSIATAALK